MNLKKGKSMMCQRYRSLKNLIAFCTMPAALSAMNEVSAQQMPTKGQPIEQAGSAQTGNSVIAANTPANAGFSSNTQIESPNADCTCQRNAQRKRWFRRKCRLHPDVDLSMIPNPFEEIPLGLQLNETMSTQVRKYENTRQILYHYDFIDGTTELNYAGRQKLARISEQAFSNFAPIIVESTPRQPGLDLSRRLQLVQTITNQGLPIPAERIIVSDSTSSSLRGPDAVILNQGQQNALGQGGSSPGAQGMTSGGVGGLSGSGLLPNTQNSQSGNSGF